MRPERTKVCCLDVSMPFEVKSTTRLTTVGGTLTQTLSPVTHCSVLSAHWQSSMSWVPHTVQLAHARSLVGIHSSLSYWFAWHWTQSWQTPSLFGEKVPGRHMATKRSELSMVDMSKNP